MTSPTSPAPSRPTTSIHPDTGLGPVALTVSDLGRSQQFYEHAVGLRASERDDGTVALSAEDSQPLVLLRGDSAAPHISRVPFLALVTKPKGVQPLLQCFKRGWCAASCQCCVHWLGFCWPLRNGP